MNELQLAPEAATDLIAAYRWYENQRVGLGDAFLRSIDAILERARRTPAIFPTVTGDYRQALCRRFPYACFFIWSRNVVTFYGVFHTSMDQSKWTDKLAGRKPE